MRTEHQPECETSHELSLRGGCTPEWQAPLARWLDLASTQMMGGQVPRGMNTLFSALRHTRATMLPEDWRRFCLTTCRARPIWNLVSQDALTRRGFQKPRNYAGDAVLLDLFYEDVDPACFGTSAVGLEIYRFLCEQRSVSSLRGRRNLLAQRIDEVASQVADARILSVACGHLREAHLSNAVRERRLGEFLALDQDTASLAVVNKELGHQGVKTVLCSVKGLLKNQVRFDGLDFVYAAGLYDYLAQPVAISLTQLLFSMLRPGGRLLLANYADPLPDFDFKAYMEAFMDWWLIYRQESDVEEWLQRIPTSQIGSSQVFRDETENLIYLEVSRR